MARKHLRKHGVIAPPVPVEYMLFTEGFRVEKVPYPDGIAGESWWEGEVGHIAVHQGLAPGRLRFTLAHEFAHLALRHHQRQWGDLLAPQRRFRDVEEIVWEPADPVEREANQFAAELLMPLTLFRKDWERRPDARWLAARYEVSLEAARRRIFELADGG